MKPTAKIIVISALLAFCSTSLANELLVPSQYSTIQSAIDAAVDGDAVIVAPGTYTGSGNRDIDFLGKAITVRSTAPNDPNIVAATIIDCNGSEIEPHRGFIFQSDEDANSVLDGLTIKNGYDHLGVGILCHEANPSISNCDIINNTAVASGAGMFNDNSNPTLINCTFRDNHVTSCVLSIGGGGGMTNCSSSPTVVGCRFIGNSGPCGGGGMANWWAESCPSVTNSIFSGNTSSGMGNNCESSPVVVGCIFADNSDGGMYGNNAVLINCVFERNITEISGGGIAVLAGGDGGIFTVINCTFTGNSAKVSGGAILIEGSSATVVNCTFAGNIAPDGNAVACDSYEQARPSTLQLTNCILWDGTSEIWNNDNSTITVTYSDVQDGWLGLGNIDVDPCFVEPGYWDANGTPEEPNDDFWVDGDYHLKSQGWRWDSARGRWDYDDITSRCIDAGNPGSPLGDELLSVPDDPDNIWGQNLRIDMGAYGGTAEASMSPYDWAMLGDLTNDGLVDLKDYAFQAADWLNSADQQPGDLNRDGLIDIDDLALLVEDWLGQTTWH